MRNPLLQISEVFLKRTILVLIGVFCYLYTVLASDFAEWHIKFGFWDFPVFVGEFLLVICLALLALLWFNRPAVALTTVSWLLAAYVLWLLMKTATGYFSMGSLALRNAALFYYPVFALMGYWIFDHALLTSRFSKALLGVLGLTLLVVPVNEYCVLAYLLLCLGFVLQLSSPWQKGLGICLIVLYALNSSLTIFSSRSHLIGVGGVFIFAVGYFVFGMVRSRWRVKLFVAIILAAVFLFLSLKAGNFNSIRSIVAPQRLYQEFAQLVRIVDEQKASYVAMPLETRVYNENERNRISHAIFVAKSSTIGPKPGPARSVPSNDATAAGALRRAQKLPKAEIKERSLEIACNNIYFRLLIWRDMFKELSAENAWWGGINFGKPQRSPSIEILDWAAYEWRHVGWIAAHNSFLHMIYRGGVVGMIVILVLVGSLLTQVKIFCATRSIWGGLLIAILLYWVLIANFLVFLELPHNAIPFWTLLGMSAAYADRLKSRPSLGERALPGAMMMEQQ